jgi:Fe2+ or Zn2+ uptake regulation protein
MSNTDNKPSIYKELRQRGHRITRSRKAVIQVLDETDSYLQPDEILERAKVYYPSIGLVTVYRTLSLLSELGFIRRIHFADGCHGYARTCLSHGHHLVCRLCQDAVEFPGSEDIEPWVAQVSKKTGFLIEDHILELLGVCPACQIEENPAS